MISLEMVKKFISDIVILLNFIKFRVSFQFISLTFIRSVEIVIRIYMKIIIIVKIIITVGKNTIFLNRRAWIVNHFGINPRNGGIPLSDKKFIIKNNFGIMLLFNDW